MAEERVEAGVGEGEALHVGAHAGERRGEVGAHVAERPGCARSRSGEDLFGRDVEQALGAREEVGALAEVEPEQAVPLDRAARRALGVRAAGPDAVRDEAPEAPPAAGALDALAAREARPDAEPRALRGAARPRGARAAALPSATWPRRITGRRARERAILRGPARPRRRADDRAARSRSTPSTPSRASPSRATRRRCACSRTTRSDRWLQAVAAEMNLSETAFLWREGPGYRLRWFTPTVEVPLCGHATLASAHLLFETRPRPTGDELRFATKSGELRAVRAARRTPSSSTSRRSASSRPCCRRRSRPRSA